MIEQLDETFIENTKLGALHFIILCVTLYSSPRWQDRRFSPRGLKWRTWEDLDDKRWIFLAQKEDLDSVYKVSLS